MSIRKRIPAFERLETRSTPSSVLLALAPLDESFHLAVEQVRESGSSQVANGRDPSGMVLDTSANWRFEISTRDLLRFVAENTCRRDCDSARVATPTPEQCQRVDETMKLGDGDIRFLVIADSISTSDE